LLRLISTALACCLLYLKPSRISRIDIDTATTATPASPHILDDNAVSIAIAILFSLFYQRQDTAEYPTIRTAINTDLLIS
jgi:hypothetical protein